MREMKDSGIEWIGKIPQGWTISRLKYALKEPMKYGATDTGIDYDESLPRYIRITDITSDGKLKDEGKLSLSEESAKKYLLDEKTVLFARSGGTVGKAFLYKKELGRAAFAGYLISAIADKRKMLPEWLMYYANSAAYSEWVNRIFTQATIQNIGADKYSEMPIPICPNISEQSQIIALLDAKCSEIDALTADIQSQIDTLEQYKRSVITEAVTRGLDKNVEMKDSGFDWLGFIPSTWQTRKGKYIFVQRNERGNSIELQLLSPTQKYGVIPQDLYEEISGYKAVKLDEKTDYSLLKHCNLKFYVISRHRACPARSWSSFE